MGRLSALLRPLLGVDLAFLTDLLPADAGLIVADAYDGEIQRWPAPSLPAPAAAP
ncbi:MAG: hypothetical protein U1E59_13810 [Amaricoccus sp.]